MLAQFRRFNIGSSPYAHYDVVAIDQARGRLVFASVVGYTTVINTLAKEVNKVNNVYAEGPNYTRTLTGQSFDVERRKQGNSDFTHMIASRKDSVTDSEGDELLDAYFYCRTPQEKASRLFDKLYKNTPIPILQEWIPYLIREMESSGIVREINVYYDNSLPRPFTCHNVRVTKSNLARIVSNGLRNGSIRINETNTVSDRMTQTAGLDSYLNAFGEILATKIQESFVPKFIPGESEYSPRMDDYDDSCYDAGIEIYEAQKTTMQASVNNLNVNDVTFLIGEMGTGKTLMGGGISYAHYGKDGFTAVILCPSHLTKKWKREMERFVPNAKAYIVKDLKQLKAIDKKIRNRKKKENTYIILSKETAKFGYEMRPSVRWSRSRRAFVCPECGNPIVNVIHEGTGRNRRPIIIPLDKRGMSKQYAHNQVCTSSVRVWDQEAGHYIERECGNKLWTPLNRDESKDSGWVKLGAEGWIRKDHVDEIFDELMSDTKISRKDTQFLLKLSDVKAAMDSGEEVKSSTRAPRKYPLAKYIKDNYDGMIDYFIADECHLYKGDTEQGQAFGDLASVAKKVMCLTGTLLNGYADGLFYILYRTLPALMKSEGFDFSSESGFMKAFGVIKRTNRFAMRNGRRTDERVGSTKEKRLPGVSPLVFTKFLLENAVFISLSDMAEGLPDYTEIPVAIPMDDELGNAYEQLSTDLRACMGGRDGAGVKAMGSLLQSLSVFPDMPYDQPPVIHPDSGDVLVYPPTLAQGLRTKENALLELVQRKIENGERVLVYYNWTNRTDLAVKLTAMFRDNGIQSAVLESKVEPDRREEWIEQKMEEGIQVVICNPTLVETGLDLLGFTTIVFYQVGYNIFTMRQASRRSWRLGQDHPIEVYFMYYAGTIQEQALSLMATKLQASMAIEGRFSEEGLRAMSNNEDLLTQIANSVVQGIQHTVDAGAFQAVAKTTTAARTARVRKRRSQLEVKEKPKVITLSYLMGPRKQTQPVTDTQQLMMDFLNKRNHIGNLY